MKILSCISSILSVIMVIAASAMVVLPEHVFVAGTALGVSLAGIFSIDLFRGIMLDNIFTGSVRGLLLSILDIVLACVFAAVSVLMPESPDLSIVDQSIWAILVLVIIGMIGRWIIVACTPPCGWRAE